MRSRAGVSAEAGRAWALFATAFGGRGRASSSLQHATASASPRAPPLNAYSASSMRMLFRALSADQPADWTIIVPPFLRRRLRRRLCLRRTRAGSTATRE